MDTSFIEHNLTWFGCGHEKIGLCFPEDLELFLGPVYRKQNDLELDSEFNPDKHGDNGGFTYPETAAAKKAKLKIQ